MTLLGWPIPPFGFSRSGTVFIGWLVIIVETSHAQTWPSTEIENMVIHREISRSECYQTIHFIFNFHHVGRCAFISIREWRLPIAYRRYNQQYICHESKKETDNNEIDPKIFRIRAWGDCTFVIPSGVWMLCVCMHRVDHHSQWCRRRSGSASEWSWLCEKLDREFALEVHT